MPKQEPLPPRMTRSELDKEGREIVDPVPMAPPVGYVAGMTQEQRLQQMIRTEHQRLYALHYNETFEEANDLDIDDDPIDPDTPYEENFDPMDHEVRMKLRDDEWRRTFEKRLNDEREKMGLNNAANTDKGREEEHQPSSSRSDREQKPQQREKQKTGVQSNIREGSERTSGTTEQD